MRLSKRIDHLIEREPLHPLDAKGEKWEKMILDDKGLGSEDIACADLNGDGKIDIIGVGRSTKNVKIYWNQGR